jgi:hypothetical protein
MWVEEKVMETIIILCVSTGKEFLPSAEFNEIMNAFVQCIKTQPVFTKTAAIRIRNLSQTAASPCKVRQIIDLFRC